MSKRVIFIGALVLALSSIGLADSGYSGFEKDWGSGYADRDVFGLVIPLGPQEQLVIGYMGLDVATGPGAGGGVAYHNGYIESTQTTDNGTQSTYVAGTQIGIVSGEGIAVVTSNAVVLIWQKW